MHPTNCCSSAAKFLTGPTFLLWHSIDKTRPACFAVAGHRWRIPFPAEFKAIKCSQIHMVPRGCVNVLKTEQNCSN